MTPRWKITLAAALLAIAAAPSRADLVTGNPVADGWTQGGHAPDLGTYVRGSGAFDYTLYTRTFSLESSSALYNGTSWQAGDVILGVGGTVLQTTDLTQSVRIVAKYGTAASTFSASSTATPPGNGNGSFSGGFAGEGGILLGTRNPAADGQYVIPANAGVIQNYSATGSVMQQIVGGTAVNVSPTTFDAGRLIFLTGNNAGTTLSSFEVYLNVSRLQRLGYTVDPAPGNKFVLTLQRSNNESLYMDALGVTAVPEPSSLVLSGLGIACLAGIARRRFARTVKSGQ